MISKVIENLSYFSVHIKFPYGTYLVSNTIYLFFLVNFLMTKKQCDLSF